MIHYHVWFNLKPGVREADGLAVVGRFLTNLCASDEATKFQLLRNKGGPPRSKLPRYHALVQFVDEVQLAEAMKKQAARGIHSGLHGNVIDVVTDFHVEIFSLMEEPLIDSILGL
ncbi:DUF6614 family protein [Opitutus sp. GAS368]|uniref:DUF6614 family protein n=1 Tax=Opitutus sp. GAS368 TaxID=1882749 RepID=UPI00087988AE|nr:DUF6614 family protein [Opitutus sp. GAS368]SDR71003.1 hypothetical protein SAMN05444173_0534 [Opitutus sp. GAS368]